MRSATFAVRHCRRLLALALTALLCACGGRHASVAGNAATAPQTPSAQPGGLSLGVGFLPSPSSLARGASTSASDDDRLDHGGEWDALLPSNRVSGAVFSPDYAGAAGRTVADTAFAIYRFNNMATNPYAPKLTVAWDGALDTPQNVYAGLANFTTNSWDWYKLTDAAGASLPSWDDYSDQGYNTLVVLLSVDNGSFGVDWVLAGDNTHPELNVSTSLNPDPALNIAPLTVSFDATASRSYGGTITGYDFDFDGDGTWEVQNDQSGLAIHQYAAGNYVAKVRATDNLGQTTVAQIDVTAVDPANQPPVPGFTRTPPSGNAPLTVDFDASGSNDPDGSITKYEWDFDGDGQFEVAGSGATASHVFAIAGSNTVTLRVTDNYFAKSVTSQSVNVVHGWHSCVVDSSASISFQPSMITTDTGSGERACVAYSDNTDPYTLRFCRATNANSSAWGPIRNPIVSSSPRGYSPSMVKAVSSGVPLIACGGLTALHTAVFFVSAKDPAGAAWNAPEIVNTDLDAGADVGLGLVNTVPALAAVSNESDSGVCAINFFLATDGAGSGWNAPQVAVAALPDKSYRDLRVGQAGSGVFKHPMVSYSIETGLSYTGFGLCVSSDINGEGWPSALTYPVYCDCGSILTLDGNAAVCASSNLDGSSVYFARALDADATSWPPALSMIHNAPAGCSMLIWDSTPCICFFDRLSQTLQMQSALDAAGSAWNPPYVIFKGAGFLGEFPAMTLVDGSPVICMQVDEAGPSKLRAFSTY